MKNFWRSMVKPSAYKVIGAVAGLAMAGFLTITALADTPGTITGDNVNVRSEANTTSTVLTKAKSNESITIIEETKGTDGNKWYKIKTSGGTTGFVRADFVKSGTATTTTTTITTTTTTTTTKVTPVENKTAYVSGTGAVNIRKDATTTAAVVANAQAKSELTITGETTAADGYKWYQIKFTANGTAMTGFIRSDLVTFTAPAGTDDKPAETTIDGGTDPTSEVPSEEMSEMPETSEEPANTGVANTAQLQFLEPVGEPSNIPAGYEKVDVMMGDQVYSAWAKGDYYIVYGMSGNSDAQWYVYDYKNNSFVSYDGLFSEEATKKSSSFNPMLLVIILAVLCAILLIAAIIFAVKAFSNKEERYEDDYDIDYDDDDDEDEGDDYEEFDDDEDDYYDEKPAKTSRVILPKKAEKPAKVESYYDDEEEEEYEDEDEYEEEEEEYVKPAKKQKAKKEKKSFKNKILDYFTVSEDDEEDEEEYEDEDEYEEDGYYEDQDDDEMNFIDL